jgi:predicted nucleotidyltransferase
MRRHRLVWRIAGFLWLGRVFIALAFAKPKVYNVVMISPGRSGSELLSLLRAHEAELRARGIDTLTIFGSVARGDVAEDSDVDLAIRPGSGFSAGGFDHFGKLDALRDRLTHLLGCNVDLVEVAAARPRLRQAIEREGLRAF